MKGGFEQIGEVAARIARDLIARRHSKCENRAAEEGATNTRPGLSKPVCIGDEKCL